MFDNIKAGTRDSKYEDVEKEFLDEKERFEAYLKKQEQEKIKSQKKIEAQNKES